VAPMLDEDAEIEVDDEDVEMQVFRSSGAGGQHVNKTSSAVRLIHKPTSIVVSCQVERSQLQNRTKAMAMLKARLAELEVQRREEEMASIKGEQQRVGFGSQIRSYVLQPYQMVKDLRTEHESGNVQGVLDGDLDPFIEAYLRWRRG
jgi:peptide chain release factor 2